MMRVRREADLRSAALWCIVAAAAMITTVQLGRALALRSSTATWQSGAWLAPFLAWLATLAVAALSTWRLVRLGAYSALVMLGALGLLLVEPGRAGDVATWRLEWGVFGALWAAAAVAVFARVIGRQDERDRRVHSEGAALGLTIGVSAAVVYALFEQVLPPLHAQRVAVALLAAWLAGRFIVAHRYR